MSFLAPAWLWALPLVALLWFYPSRLRDSKHGLLRSALFLALIFALARPVRIASDEVPRHVFVVDRSTSLDAAGEARARDVLAKLTRSTSRPCERILVDLAPPSRRFEKAPDGVDRVLAMNGDSSSPLSDALALAAASIPEGAPGAITLVSDGLATDRAWGSVFADLVRRGLPLHTVQLEAKSDDPRPVGLVFEDVIRSGHGSRARVRLLGRADDVSVVLARGDEVLARRDDIALEDRMDLALSFEAPAAGFHDVELRLEVRRGADARRDNNRLRTRIAVQDPLRVLYLGDRVRGAADGLRGLLGKGFELREPSDGAGLELLDDVDLVFLDDRPARALSPEWRKAIAAAVEQRGVGLFASGGRAAFGAGGYHRTEIADMLPVDFVQKEEKKDPSTTLAIIIDTSGSMIGNRMTLAKQVARLAMRRLQPHDKVGIVEFYGTKTWAAPIQSAANQIDLQRALNRLAAQGGTVLMPAIEEAYYALKNVQTRYKHVLVLTDAGVETGPYEALCRRMSDEGMTVSTVLVGPGRHSDFLVDLADWGGGRYYNAADRFNLPELLLKKPSTSVLPSYRPERTDVETSGARGWWGEVDPKGLPPVDGFVESELREGAEAVITTKKTKAPLLASQLHGLGRVTALMTEPLGPGTRSWSRWSGYGPLLGRLLTRTARGRQRPFELRCVRRGDRIRIDARRLVRAPVVPDVRIFDASQPAESTGLAMREIAPGYFRGKRYWPQSEALDLRVSTVQGGLAPTLIVSPVRADRAPETQVDPGHGFPLAAAAKQSGGRHFASGAGTFALAAAPGSRPVRLVLLWPWFVLLALLFFVGEIFYRRRSRTQGEIA